LKILNVLKILKNFQVDSGAWIPDPLIPPMTVDSFVHCAMFCKGAGDMIGWYAFLTNDYYPLTSVQPNSCDSFTYEEDTGLCQFGGLLLPPLLPAGNLKVWGVRQPWPPALEVSSSGFIAENFPAYLGTYNMTGSYSAGISWAGGGPHYKVYPTYENANGNGYKISPGRNDDTTAWEWEVNGLYPTPPSPGSDLIWEVSSWTRKTASSLDADPTMRVQPVH